MLHNQSIPTTQVSINDQIQDVPVFQRSTISKKLGIFDVDVVRELVARNSTAHFHEIREAFCHKINRCRTLEDMVETARTEVIFHDTVDLIKADADNQGTEVLAVASTMNH